MLIKTITCHEVYNHGASLQEYALLEFLNNNGYQAETLHYKPNYLSGHFNLWAVSNPRFDYPIIKQLYLLAKLPSRIRILPRKKAFDDFAKKNIPTDKILYKSNDELKANLPQADAYICGSDQIWNSFFQNGKDPAFYLNFVPDYKKKISYAASFAIDKIKHDVQPLVKDNVSTFHAVGVRESSGVRILNELGIDNAVQVLDPVFLLDKEHWISKFVKPINEKFIFIYDFDSNSLIKKIALKLKKEKGFKIYTVNQNIDYADKNFWLDGPETFLSLVNASQLNITNSFHAVAFSLILEKQLVVVNRKENINTRMRDLLSLFNLSEYLISEEKEFQSLPESMDFSSLSVARSFHIQRSKDFLTSALQK
ncbi:polysaccharide pyruvyl transferase family protein [Chryseobacterium sp. T1]